MRASPHRDVINQLHRSIVVERDISKNLVVSRKLMYKTIRKQNELGANSDQNALESPE